MGFDELTTEENLALVGLLKAVIQADKVYSEGESGQLKKIAQQMGEPLFHSTVEKARERFKTRGDIQRFAATITRPGARQLIFDTLYQMAVADSIVPAEKDLLNWLAKLWGLSLPVQKE
jgi:uncharacterized tellurite resistance protein B-like protein